MAGGPQGSGVDSAANIFARACCYGGLHVYGKREYHSNIKGMHSYFHVRISEKEVRADLDRVDLLCTFDSESIVRHIREVSAGGGIVCDADVLATRLRDIATLPLAFWAEFKETLDDGNRKAETVGDLLKEAEGRKAHVYAIPYMELLKQLADKIGEERLSRLTRMINVLALGASFGLIDYDKTLVEKAIQAVFRDKPKIVAANLMAFNLAYEYVGKSYQNLDSKLTPVRTDEKRIFVQGTQAVALGKLVGGCRLQAYYPITPAADESEYLEENELFELVSESGEGSILVIQTEDEIAAVNMASGAALTGTRAATSTSGPGFSLMVEGLSWAGNNEVPVVINHYQRGAPSTGLPTRHGQDDLQFTLHAGHGEFPRIVVCSGDIEECFYDAAQAFNYAERYQLPVIHLIDKALANSSKTCKMFNVNRTRIDRGQLLAEADLGGKEYKRFQFTESGISPRLPLGTPGTVFWHTGDEHDELGHVCEEPINRTRMIEKRMKKLEIADREIAIQERANLFGDPEAANTIVSWGSPKGAITETIERLRTEGYDANFLQIRMPHPLPAGYVSEILQKAQRKIVVEGNYSAQLAEIIRERTGVVMDYYVLKWTGRPFSADEVHSAIRLIMQNKAPTRQVLTHGA